jgi:hypothetical protein
MGQVKPWQIVLIVAALAAAGTSAYLTLSGGSPVPLDEQVLLVDVTNGDLFAFSTAGHRAVVPPAKNPETGKVALFQVYKNEAGDWMVSGRQLGALALVEGEPKALLDRKTGKVRVSSETPKPLK